MITFNIDIRALKGTAIAASKEETRYYLKGVCLQHDKDGLVYTATDGHRLIATRHIWDDGKSPAHFEPVIIPSSLIKMIKVNRKIDRAEIKLETIEGARARMIRITYCGVQYAENEIEGTFPDWRRVMPREQNREYATYNADYVSSFKDAIKAMGGASEPIISHNGNNPAFVAFGALDTGLESFGVIMPMGTSTNRMYNAPTWALTESQRAARETIANADINAIEKALNGAQEKSTSVQFNDVCNETAYGSTQRLSASVRVF
jgi:hypothetical protein